MTTAALSTEPIGSIPRPPETLRAVDRHKYPIMNPCSQGRITFSLTKSMRTLEKPTPRNVAAC